jgi:hypothetical protein
MVEYEDCSVVNESQSGKALLISIPDVGRNAVWVPKSQIKDISEVYRAGHGDDGSRGTLVVSLWLAEKEGWPT